MSTRNISFNLYVLLAILATLDIYVYRGLNPGFGVGSSRRWIRWMYLLAVGAGYVGFYFLYTYFTVKPLHPELIPNLFIGFFFSFLVFKLVMLVTFLGEDLVRLTGFLWNLIRSDLKKGQEMTRLPGRRKFIQQAGLFLAAIPFSSMMYGITKGKYNFKVNDLVLEFDNLPMSFDGFRIVHISDIHAGSFEGSEGVLRGIDLINRQEADLILFTGDLVNNDSKEIQPFVSEFMRLQSKHGVLSTLGNHDYGDYKSWSSRKAKEYNMKLLYDFQRDMGFHLLNNQNRRIEVNGESIGIYGVENWGNPPFPQRGDLDKALEGAEDEKFKILMSHDPTHWNKKVIDHPVHFDLTLSGHTHGMQFGVEIPGFKWSPIKYIYPQWAGLYREKSQLLYVNRGFGYLGFPGRVGIWPEITVFELRRS